MWVDLVFAAAERLRLQCWLPADEVTPLTAWPDVPSTYVLCCDERAVNPEWSRHVARHRLGVEPIELPGGHSPLLARPEEVARILLDVATG